MVKTLSKHPLIADAMEGLRPSMIASQPRVLARIRKLGTPRAKNPKPLKSAVERFHHLVFYHAAKVTTDFDNLEHIMTMVRKQPPRFTLKKWDLSGDRWLEFQYTLHLVTLVGAVDRTLIVVNAVLGLGLAPPDCTERLLLRHAQIEGTRLSAAIKDLSRDVQPTRNHRNLDVHQKDLPPFHEIVGWEDYDWLPMCALVGKDDEVLIPPAWLQKGFRYAGQLLSLRMQKERTRLKNRVWRIFDLLVPIARRRAAAFAQTGGWRLTWR
jgi:hypothetical protein